MKTLYFSLLILVINCSISYSQNIIGYGFKIGLSNSYYTYESPSLNSTGSADSRVGLDCGLFIEFFNYKSFRLLSELHYEQKGIRFSPIEFDPSLPERGNTTLHYLSFQLFAKPQMPLKFLTAYLIAGPRGDYLISYNENVMNGIYSNINKFNFGFSAGFGVETKLINKYLIAEFKYSYDFSSSKLNDDFTVLGRKVKVSLEENNTYFSNRSFELLIGLKF